MSPNELIDASSQAVTITPHQTSRAMTQPEQLRGISRIGKPLDDSNWESWVSEFDLVLESQNLNHVLQYSTIPPECSTSHHTVSRPQSGNAHVSDALSTDQSGSQYTQSVHRAGQTRASSTLQHCTSTEDATVRLLIHRNIAQHLWELVKAAPTAMHMWDLLAASFTKSVQVTASTIVQRMISFRHLPGEAVTTSNLRMRELLTSLDSLQLTATQLSQHLAMEFYSRGCRPDLAPAVDALRLHTSNDITLADLQHAVVTADQRTAAQQYAAHSFAAVPSFLPVQHVQARQQSGHPRQPPPTRPQQTGRQHQQRSGPLPGVSRHSVSEIIVAAPLITCDTLTLIT
jgi:hypothetical protein